LSRLSRSWSWTTGWNSVYNFSPIEAAIVGRLTGSRDEVVFDLARVRVLYSSGIGILVRVHKRVEKQKGKIYLVNVPRTVAQALTSLHLDSVFDIYATDVEFEISHDGAWAGNPASHE
jgi:anti-anti-sigma factor